MANSRLYIRLKGTDKRLFLGKCYSSGFSIDGIATNDLNDFYKECFDLAIGQDIPAKDVFFGKIPDRDSDDCPFEVIVE